MIQTKTSALSLLIVVHCLLRTITPSSAALSSIRASVFHGKAVVATATTSRRQQRHGAVIEMRKQKASNRRTRRRQQRQDLQDDYLAHVTKGEAVAVTLTSSPMNGNEWRHKRGGAVASTKGMKKDMPNAVSPRQAQGGRQRSRKRSTLYSALSFYHNTFLNHLTAEYQAEVGFISARAEFFQLFDSALTLLHLHASALPLPRNRKPKCWVA